MLSFFKRLKKAILPSSKDKEESKKVEDAKKIEPPAKVKKAPPKHAPKKAPKKESPKKPKEKPKEKPEKKPVSKATKPAKKAAPKKPKEKPPEEKAPEEKIEAIAPEPVVDEPIVPEEIVPEPIIPEEIPSEVTPEPIPEPIPEPEIEPEVTPEPEPIPEPEPEPIPEPEPEPEEKGGWMQRLRQGLGKSTRKITDSLASVFGKPSLEPSDIEAIEDALIMADLGIEAAGRIASSLGKRRYPDGVNAETLTAALAEEIASILAPIEQPLGVDSANSPHVILMVGVNGSGKTTTAAKLAEFFSADDKSVMFAAADTFRAAAVEQLQIWGERTKTQVITGSEGTDAAAVAFKAMEEAKQSKTDILIIDTAGRLQNRKELMDELAKIRRVLTKQDETAPHDTIIVLDGTVGQNALSQVEAFNETVELTGMIITKLDGSARGGVIVALAEKYDFPVHAVGVGEHKEDLQPFEAEAYAHALAGSYQVAFEE